MAQSTLIRNKGILASIERVGNKMPHPIALFLGIIIIVLVLSFILSLLGVSAVHPHTKAVLPVKNLLSVSALLDWGGNLSRNLQNFPVLASVLILAACTGVCEQTGFFSTMIKSSLRNASGNAVIFTIALVGSCGNIAGDVSFLIVSSLSATIFYGIGRNPLVGLFLGYAAVGGGYGTNLIPGGWDVILTPVTVQAAQLIDPTFDMNLVSGYYMMVVGTFVAATTATIVTIKFIEPKFGPYKGTPEGLDAKDSEVTPLQTKALKRSLIVLSAYLLFIVVMCIPQNSFLRSPTGSLTVNSPLMKTMYAHLVLAFLLPGLTFGITTGKIKNIKSLSDILTKSIINIAPFIVIAIIVSQFLFLFAQSNLGTVLAIQGGEALKAMAVPVLVIVIAFFLLEGIADLFIVSGSSRYLIFGPVFVPMLMQLGIHPAFVQMLHRTGGSICNHLTPLNSFFPVLYGLAQKYDKNIGIGTIFSTMIPYTIGYTIAYLAMIIIWMTFGLPTGFDTPIFLGQ